MFSQHEITRAYSVSEMSKFTILVLLVSLAAVVWAGNGNGRNPFDELDERLGIQEDKMFILEGCFDAFNKSWQCTYTSDYLTVFCTLAAWLNFMDNRW